MSTENFSRKTHEHGALILASAMFVYFLSTSTSPRYEFLGDDSAIFQAVGASWAQGYLPYVDLFENKGALIFLIDALGYSIAPRVGIMLLQIPAMYLSMLFMWRTLGLYLSGKARLAAMAMTLIYYALYYLDGNRTEEWSMPFLAAAMYLFLRGLKNSQWSPYVGLIDGVGFGACVLLRATNAMPLCCCALLSAIFLLRDGELKLLRQNLLTFCAGVVIMLLPFVMYFAAHGALYDMLYGTILLNVIYTTGGESYPLNEYFVMYVLTKFIPLIVLTALSVSALFKDTSRLTLSGLFIGAAMLAFMIKLRPYIGYCALIVPTMPLMFIIADRVAKIYLEPLKNLLLSKNFLFRRLAAKFLVVSLIFTSAFYIWGYTLTFTTKMTVTAIEELWAKAERGQMLRLKAMIPAAERNSFVTWGRSGFVARWILITGMMSREKFFGYIKSFGAVDPSIRTNWFASVQSKPPQWILYCWKKNDLYTADKDSVELKFLGNKDAELEKLLREKYTLTAIEEISFNIVKLYRLKE